MPTLCFQASDVLANAAGNFGLSLTLLGGVFLFLNHVFIPL